MQCTTIKFQKQSSWTLKGDQKAKGAWTARGGSGAAKRAGLVGGTAPPVSSFALAMPVGNLLFSMTSGTIRLWANRPFTLGWRLPAWGRGCLGFVTRRVGGVRGALLRRIGRAFCFGLTAPGSGPWLPVFRSVSEWRSAWRPAAPREFLCFLTHLGPSACGRRWSLCFPLAVVRLESALA